MHHDGNAFTRLGFRDAQPGIFYLWLLQFQASKSPVLPPLHPPSLKPPKWPLDSFSDRFVDASLTKYVKEHDKEEEENPKNHSDNHRRIRGKRRRGGTVVRILIAIRRFIFTATIPKAVTDVTPVGALPISAGELGDMTWRSDEGWTRSAREVEAPSSAKSLVRALVVTAREEQGRRRENLSSFEFIVGFRRTGERVKF